MKKTSYTSSGAIPSIAELRTLISDTRNRPAQRCRIFRSMQQNTANWSLIAVSMPEIEGQEVANR